MTSLAIIVAAGMQAALANEVNSSASTVGDRQALAVIEGCVADLKDWRSVMATCVGAAQKDCMAATSYDIHMELECIDAETAAWDKLLEVSYGSTTTRMQQSGKQAAALNNLTTWYLKQRQNDFSECAFVMERWPDGAWNRTLDHYHCARDEVAEAAAKMAIWAKQAASGDGL